MEGISQLNPYATPFVPASRTVFLESFNEGITPEKILDESEKYESADKSVEHQFPDSFSPDDCIQSLEKLDISPESSSKGDISGSLHQLSQYEESDADDPVLQLESIAMMFPDVSTDFIFEALKANEFDTHLTVHMLSELLYADNDYGYPPEASECSSSSGGGNLELTSQDTKPTATSDAV